MISFPDTSFLYALYRPQSRSAQADAHMAVRHEPLPVSTLLLLEFRQSVRFQIWLQGSAPTKGFPPREGAAMLRCMQSDLAAGVLGMVAADWPEVHRLAETLSTKYTQARGDRLIDVLHVATALHLGAEEFLTFDRNQGQLAKAEGLTVPV